MFTQKYRFSYTRVCCSGAMAKTCKTRFNCFFQSQRRSLSARSLSHCTLKESSEDVVWHAVVRASGPVVGDLQNTGEFGRFATIMPAVSLSCLNNRDPRGAFGEQQCRAGINSGPTTEPSDRFKRATKDLICSIIFLQVVPRSPRSLWGFRAVKFALARHARSAGRGSFTTARTHLSLSCTINQFLTFYFSLCS